MTIDAQPVVLVADDEPSMLSLISAHAKTLGLEVHVAHDGDEAWEKAQALRPDLLLLDVNMPGMSGWEVCRNIRSDGRFKRTGVIMVTGFNEKLNEINSPLFGADNYIDKPFEFKDLDRMIHEVLEKRGGWILPSRSAPEEAEMAEDSDKKTAGQAKVARKIEAGARVGAAVRDATLRAIDESHHKKGKKPAAKKAAKSAKPAKPAAKKAAKPAAKKAAVKKPAAKKPAAKKAAAKKPAAKKPAAKKAAAKKPVKKAAKPAAKKPAARKPAAKKPAAKKPAAKKAPAKKPAAKKAAAKKPAARKPARKKS